MYNIILDKFFKLLKRKDYDDVYLLYLGSVYYNTE